MHAEVLLPWINELLAEAELAFGDLDGIAVDRGPGGFTSLRIGLGVAQGIALAHDLPCYPVSSLAAMAHASGHRAPRQRVLAALDARMGEIYAGWFVFDEAGWPQPDGPERLLSPQALSLPDDGPFIAVGDALVNYADELKPRLDRACSSIEPDVIPTSASVATLAKRAQPQSGHALAPVYLRDQVTS